MTKVEIAEREDSACGTTASDRFGLYGVLDQIRVCRSFESRRTSPVE
jgi:hypothetical protein